MDVEVPPPPPTCSKVNSIQFPDLKRPWRVDNTAKAILDDVASRLKADPNAKIVIVGYADGEKAPMEGTGKKRHPMNLAAQRAVNAKAYLVQQQGIDPSRVEVRQGTGQQKVADIIWVPQGADENACADLQNTTPVDESVVKPSENAYPKPKKAARSEASQEGRSSTCGRSATVTKSVRTLTAGESQRSHRLFSARRPVSIHPPVASSFWRRSPLTALDVLLT